MNSLIRTAKVRASGYHRELDHNGLPRLRQAQVQPAHLRQRGGIFLADTSLSTYYVKLNMVIRFLSRDRWREANGNSQCGICTGGSPR